MDHRLRRELVTGDYPQLEAAFTARVRELRRADPLAPLVVLVPTHLLRQHLSRMLADRGLAQLNVRFVTFADLIAQVGKRMHPLAGELMIEQACAVAPRDSYFSRLRDRPGLHRAIVGSINDLKEATLTVDRFAAAIGKKTDLSATARRKLSSLLDVWREYESLKAKHGLTDESDLHIAATRDAGRLALLAGSQGLLVYGIYDFKGMQLQLLLNLAEGRDTTIYFPFQPTEAFDYAKPAREDLLAAGFEEQTITGEVAGLPIRAAAEIVSCPGDSAEAAEIARTVLGLARTTGASFSEVAVLARSPMPLLRGVRESLEAMGAKPCGLAGLPLCETRAGRTFRLMLQVIQDEFARRSVMELLTFADIDFDASFKVSEGVATRWDSLSIRAGIVQGRGQWIGRLRGLRERMAHPTSRVEEAPEPDGQSEQLQVIDAMIAGVQSLFDRMEAIRDAKNWAGMVARAAEAFEWLVRKTEERDEISEAIRELTKLAPILNDGDFARLVRLATEVLESDSPPSGGFQRDGPALVGIMQARGVPFRVVIVPGIVERVFPQPPSQDPILLDHERQAINQVLAKTATAATGPVPRLPLKHRQVLEERLLFRLVVGAATERIIFTYPRLEAETGRERIASHFLLDVLQSMTGEFADYEKLAKKVRKIPLRDPEPDPARVCSLLEFDLAHARLAIGRDGERGRLLAFCDGLLSRHFARGLRAETKRWSQEFAGKLTEFDGLVSDADLLAALRRRSPLQTVISPSRLEDYATCPFQFFLHYVLRLDPIDEPEALTRSEPKAKGEMVHAVLCEFLQKMIDEHRVPIDEGCGGELMEIAERHIKMFEERGLAGPPLVWQVERERLRDFFRDFLVAEIEREKEHVPIHLEMPFGNPKMKMPAGTDAEPPELNVGGVESLRFHGFIDRLDRMTGNPHELYVIDYKGRKVPEIKPDGLGLGTAVQLPIYLMGAQAALKPRGEFDLAGAEYVSYDPKAGSKPVRLERPTAESRTRLIEVLRTIAEGIHGGLFMQYPSEKTCGFCDFSGVCMGVQHAIAQRKSGDRAAEQFLAMKTFEPAAKRSR